MKRPALKLFANCIPVRGARRSLLCDLQTGRLKLIPNSLYELLTEHKDRTVCEVKAAYDHKYDGDIDEYYQFLISHGWGFWCEEPEAFPDLAMDYDIPELITHAIIDSDAGSDHDYIGIIDQLEDLGCKHIELRFFEPVALRRIETLAAASEGRRLLGIEILTPYTREFADRDFMTEWCRRFPRIIRLALTGAPSFHMAHTSPNTPNMGLLVYHPLPVDSHRCCGVVDKMYFGASVESFTEALNYNSCLNRKISVDTRGNIRNCPSMEASFGNIRETSLREAMFQEGFQEIWAVTKDQVETCRDCEFRYVCTDCRAFTREGEAPFRQPARCGYDPYNATWRQPSEASFSV